MKGSQDSHRRDMQSEFQSDGAKSFKTQFKMVLIGAPSGHFGNDLDESGLHIRHNPKRLWQIDWM